MDVKLWDDMTPEERLEVMKANHDATLQDTIDRMKHPGKYPKKLGRGKYGPTARENQSGNPDRKLEAKETAGNDPG